jgi:hypothetical protein
VALACLMHDIASMGIGGRWRSDDGWDGMGCV